MRREMGAVMPLSKPAAPPEDLGKGSYSAAVKSAQPKLATPTAVGAKGPKPIKSAAGKRSQPSTSSTASGVGSTLAPPANPHKGDRGGHGGRRRRVATPKDLGLETHPRPSHRSRLGEDGEKEEEERRTRHWSCLQEKQQREEGGQREKGNSTPSPPLKVRSQGRRSPRDRQ